MKMFTIGINLANNVHFVMDVLAKDFHSAVYSWAHLTGHLDVLYNEKNHTYFGWPIVETNKQSLQRKNNPNLFQY